MRIALASCSNLPGWEVDDRPLHHALRARGVELLLPPWDDPEVDWASLDATLIRTTWDYDRRLPDFLAWAASVPRLFNPVEVVRWNTDKRYLRDLEARGLPIAPTLWLERGQALDLAGIPWERAFLKPTVAACARGTLRFSRGDPAAQAFLEERLAEESMMVQPYLARVETEGEWSAIFLDGRLSHAVQKVPVAGDYRVQDDFGASDRPIALSPARRALAEQVIAACGADLLYGRVDFLSLDDGSPVVTEVELVEPSLFFRHAPQAGARLAEALLRRLG